ncbi:MAG: type II toxin-antitoxin system prevent-host-death family antitoxin [Alphaproteobacteria bacterium]|nr:type II toxin-antitoxin system prevent-host-death family antitoxin [Alphaproteobacteria bacterium]
MTMEICEDEFNLDPVKWQAHALSEPVVITDKGQPKLYLLSKAVVDSLRHGARQSCRVEDLDAEGRRALQEAEMSPEHDHLDALLKDD